MTDPIVIFEGKHYRLMDDCVKSENTVCEMEEVTNTKSVILKECGNEDELCNSIICSNDVCEYYSKLENEEDDKYTQDKTKDKTKNKKKNQKKNKKQKKEPEKEPEKEQKKSYILKYFAIILLVLFLILFTEHFYKIKKQKKLNN